MKRKIFVFFVAVIALVLLGGCATARSAKDLEIQGLKNQVSVLEAQIQDKDQLIEDLQTSLVKQQKTSTTMVGEVKSRPSVKQIQTALSNAGYNPGPIDGKIGKRTRQAIRDFQKDKGLMVDGRVGKQTWSALRSYLNK